MIASYKDVFSRFLNKVEDYDIPKMNEETFNIIATEYLHFAIGIPRVKKLFSSITLDDVLLEFDYELKYTDDEHTDYDFVCNILSSGMVLAWIEPQVKSMNNIHQIYGGKEEKFYAQANHLSELNKLQEQCEIALSRLINSRAYINNSYLNEE